MRCGPLNFRQEILNMPDPRSCYECRCLILKLKNLYLNCKINLQWTHHLWGTLFWLGLRRQSRGTQFPEAFSYGPKHHIFFVLQKTGSGIIKKINYEDIKQKHLLLSLVWSLCLFSTISEQTWKEISLIQKTLNLIPSSSKKMRQKDFCKILQKYDLGCPKTGKKIFVNRAIKPLGKVFRIKKKTDLKNLVSSQRNCLFKVGYTDRPLIISDPDFIDLM